MYFGSYARETVSVLGTPAFMEFVESIQSEGVVLERVPMGGGATRDESLVVEVDTADGDKDIDALDIEIPRMSLHSRPPRPNRRWHGLDGRDQAPCGARPAGRYHESFE